MVVTTTLMAGDPVLLSTTCQYRYQVKFVFSEISTREGSYKMCLQVRQANKDLTKNINFTLKNIPATREI